MPYTPPTYQYIIDRWPEFTGKQTQVEAAIADAMLEVDESWEETQYTQAVALLAAHFVADVTAGGAGAGAGRVTSESYGGEISISRSAGAAVHGEDGAHGSTLYGRRFDRLLQGNHGGPVVLRANPYGGGGSFGVM